jgi:5-methyltetrahydrofolate--homocysteine methyltransferase
MGNTPAEVVRELSAAGADALGLNCSLGPREALPIAREIRDLSALPVIVKPNAGMPDPKTGLYRLGPDDFAELMMPILELGVDYAGGCCGTEPGHIAALSRLLGR